MINLLPPDVKQTISYGRHNTKLLRWSIALILAIAGVGAVCVAGTFYINQSANSYSAQVDKGQAKGK